MARKSSGGADGRQKYSRERKALVVHRDMHALMNYQTQLSAAGIVPIIARDLGTALAGMTQHYFEMAIISAQLGEGGDGWALGGVFRMVFPRAYVAVLAPQTTVETLQMAINSGVSQVFEAHKAPDEIVTAIFEELTPTHGVVH
jgi:DNA-binding NtrC family response regulator